MQHLLSPVTRCALLDAGYTLRSSGFVTRFSRAQHTDQPIVAMLCALFLPLSSHVGCAKVADRINAPNKLIQQGALRAVAHIRWRNDLRIGFPAGW